MENQKKILLVEDEASISQLYTHILSRYGYTVTAAMDGEEGLKLAQEQKPDLVLLDVMMPKMHGVEVLKHLKESPDTQNIPVIMLTNLGDEEIVKEAMQNGAMEYLVKAHINPTELAQTVTNLLQKSVPETV